jgi:adenine-specific DNA-methyltransferase
VHLHRPALGIKFNSNFQWSTTSRDVKDGKADHITREPEQVRAFRDTWRDGIHSYLTYLRDRLTVARDLLAESGSIFVQIGDENVHRVRALLDEVFGDENCGAQISVKKTSGATSENLPGTTDFLLLYAKDQTRLKYRQAYIGRQLDEDGDATYTFLQDEGEQRRRLKGSELTMVAATDAANCIYRLQMLTSQSVGRTKGEGAASWFPVSI